MPWTLGPISCTFSAPGLGPYVGKTVGHLLETFEVCTVHCVYTVLSVFYIVLLAHSTVYIVQCTMYTQCVHCTVHCLHTVGPLPWAAHQLSCVLFLLILTLLSSSSLLSVLKWIWINFLCYLLCFMFFFVIYDMCWPFLKPYERIEINQRNARSDMNTAVKKT